MLPAPAYREATVADLPGGTLRVAVTGGAGFIGANLVRRLLADGASVVVLDDFSTGRRDNLRDVDVEVVEGTILDMQTLDGVLRGADAVVHLAAVPSVPRSLVDPMRSHAVNATGTLTVLEAVRRADGPYVVVASSSSVYGAARTLPKREDGATRPMSPYAVSKLATEAYTLAYAACFGLDALAFRFFNVFGPLQPAGHAYAAVIPVFVDAALHDRPLPVQGDGEQTRDFTFVDTVTSVVADALRRRVTCDSPVNLAFGTRTSLLRLIDELADVLGRELTVEHRPPRTGDVRDSQADDSLLRQLFPDLTPVGLRTGLQATVEWFQRPAVAVSH
jgi:UDP-glucose 4-epimerase